MTAVVAVYAAVIATGGLGWQIWTYRVRRSTRIILTVRHGTYQEPGTVLTGKAVYCVTVTAVNVGETTETIEAIGIEDEAHEHGIDDRPLCESLAPGHTVARRFEFHALHSIPCWASDPLLRSRRNPARCSARAIR
jgi:hypothetical protein